MAAYSPASSRTYSWPTPRRFSICIILNHVKLMMNTMIFKVFQNLIGFELYETSTVSLADSHLQRMGQHLNVSPFR